MDEKKNIPLPGNGFPERAMVLGAGLGKRLRPLTENLPKPLIPVGGEPLVCRVLRHLERAGAREVIVNTHHAAERWAEAFPAGTFGGLRLVFRHETVLLETGGGIKNAEDFLAGHGAFIVCNGDILTDLSLEEAVAHHRARGNLATLVLRSAGGPLHVALGEDGRVVDIRNRLGTGREGNRVFTGIQVLEPEIFRHIPAGKPRSIIPVYLDLIRAGRAVGGVTIDRGEWSDLGTPEEYRRVCRRLAGG